MIEMGKVGLESGYVICYRRDDFMKKFRGFLAAVLLVGILAGVNRVCFANFDSTVGYRLAEKTAQKEIEKNFPQVDLSGAEVSVDCSVESYYFLKYRGSIQVLYFWEESGESISVFVNGYLPMCITKIVNRTEK